MIGSVPFQSWGTSVQGFADAMSSFFTVAVENNLLEGEALLPTANCLFAAVAAIFRDARVSMVDGFVDWFGLRYKC